jgi:hypothetical protein
LEEEQLHDIEEALKFGNHKGATSQPELLLKLVPNDIIYSYTITLPLEKVIQLPHVCMAPLITQAQWTINKLGEIVAKYCLMHDQSFKWEKSRTSINSHCNLTNSQNACLRNACYF